MARLLILHDSVDFGGHERMAFALLPAVVENEAYDSIAFAYPEGNARLAAAIAEALPTVRQVPWRFGKKRGEPYLRFLRWRYRAEVRQLIATERPDTILLVQGRIENLATAMLAVPRSIRLVSYLPMAHRMAEMGRAGPIGDAVRRPLYRRPDAFIVPSPAVARQLAAAGATAPVTVAANVVTPPPRTGRGAARAKLDLAPEAKIALMLGRLDVAQKGLDRLAGAVTRMPAGSGWRIVVVGDGPGRVLLDSLSGTSGGTVRVVPWTDRPDLYLSAADVVLMPSRWEGLPLAALEAMAYGVPVLASSIDAFADLLPPDHLIDWERDDLVTALDRIDAPEARARFADHACIYLQSRDLAAARRAFVSGLSGRAAA